MTVTVPPATLPLDVTFGPGVYDLDEATYHGDPVPGGSLSSTGARALLSPSCPAKFDHNRRFGQRPRKVWDFGSVAHELVLHRGRGIAKLEYDSRRTNAYKADEAAARAAGKVPILEKDYAIAEAMAKALRQHKTAAALLDPDYGQPERSIFWVDPETGVNCRARLDWIDDEPGSGRLLIDDYKTVASADPPKLERSISEFGLHMQADWYETAVKRAGLAEDVRLLLIAQEKEAPYVVTVIDLLPATRLAAADRNAKARRVYAECVASGVWPGYVPDDEIASIGLPQYVLNQQLEAS